ncbi:serine protease [Paenibacillus sp.]|uniref:S1C family serine protease n=1 Tax=Paenibacillus sp. TaxID=58172 RepID=UPI00281286B6|nr:serine protease [Paenibacillus sp.]
MAEHEKKEDIEQDKVSADFTGYEDREYGREFTEEELTDLFEAADEEGEAPPPFFRSPRFQKIIAGVLALMVCAQVITLLPQVFSLAAVRFLTVSAQLSQSAEIQQYKESVVVIRSGGSKGTGFFVSEDGLVVTNRHVVDGSKTPLVHLSDGSVYQGRVLWSDDEVDLALVDIDAEAVPALPLAASYDGAEDVPVYIIGNPLFFNGIANEGVTRGLLPDRDPPMLAIDAPVYRGNSGSPVITEDGEVIGVVYATSSMERDGKKQRIGLAVPIDWVHRRMAEPPAPPAP